MKSSTVRGQGLEVSRELLEEDRGTHLRVCCVWSTIDRTRVNAKNWKYHFFEQQSGLSEQKDACQLIIADVSHEVRRGQIGERRCYRTRDVSNFIVTVDDPPSSIKRLFRTILFVVNL